MPFRTTNNIKSRRNEESLCLGQNQILPVGWLKLKISYHQKKTCHQKKWDCFSVVIKIDPLLWPILSWVATGLIVAKPGLSS